MIDLTKLNIEIPDDMTVDEMRTRVVEIVDAIKTSNQEETDISTRNRELEDENTRLRKQNLDLFNRVTIPVVKRQKEEEQEKCPTTEDILSYYS